MAHKDELGFEPSIVKVQVKSSKGSIGDPAVSALYGKVGNSEFGLLVTLGTFTTQATNFAKSKGSLRLIDGDELVQLVFQHHDQFDSRYKGLLPLRQVYVPEAMKAMRTNQVHTQTAHNKALHRTKIPLRSITTGDLRR